MRATNKKLKQTMKTKKKTKKRIKKIPPKVIEELNNDLAAFAAEFAVVNKVRVMKQVPLYLRPNDDELVSTLPGGTEHQVICSYNNRLGIVHNDTLYWTPQEHLDSIEVITSPDITTGASSWWDWGRDKLIKRAADIRDKYLNNPYVRVSGFSVGLPASLSIDFEFKD